ncbi:MAG: ATP-binding protein [Bacteroidetes bacterium]|nr:MAG: ATP-binding protein [Bacteroidota bacterium]
MISRVAKNSLVGQLQKSPAVVLTGPRQVGKTTLAFEAAKEMESVYIDLENPLDAAKIQDLAAFHAHNQHRLIILDEVQRTPEIFSPIRGIIDEQRRQGNKTGLFLFLGSASLDLLRQSGESLAGRISQLELYPINVLEFDASTNEILNTIWLRGGFPESLLAESDEDSMRWRRDFIRTYLERDIPSLGPRIPSETMRRFWTMLAHQQGTVLNAALLARNLEMSGVSVGRYIDLLVDLLLVRKIQPWSSNTGKRLVRSPKVYLRDPGMVHALLNITDVNTLLGHPVVGGSWEGFVMENILSMTPAETLPYFYRTSHGAEIDLILEWSGQEKWAIEIKKHSTPVLSKGFYTACEDIRADRKFVIYGGTETFPLPGGVMAMPLFQFIHMLSKQ